LEAFGVILSDLTHLIPKDSRENLKSLGKKQSLGGYPGKTRSGGSRDRAPARGSAFDLRVTRGGMLSYSPVETVIGCVRNISIAPTRSDHRVTSFPLTMYTLWRVLPCTGFV